MKDAQETRGVMYVATGKKYIRSAIRSARSVRKHNPDLPIHLFANWQACGFDFSHSSEPFTSVDNIANPHERSKVDYMGRTPFDRTLYLDNDTIVLEDITQLFQLLDRFEIALSHAPLRIPPSRLQPWRISLPDCFPQFNSGVIVYRNSERVLQLIRDWVNAYQQAGFKSDQVTLRELLWLSDLRIATLPPEYNLGRLLYILIWNKREARARILHLHFINKGPFWILKRMKKDLF
jgi:lipopolysaccharide biosynthesis glycosyltransferase